VNPCLHGAHETPVSWEEHSSPGRLSSEDLEVSAGNVGILNLKNMKINAAELPRSGLRRPGLQSPSFGGSQTQTRQGPETSGPPPPPQKKKGKRNYLRAGLVPLGLNFLKGRGPHRVLVNIRGGPETLVRTIKRRCPSRLGGQPSSRGHRNGCYCL
jgi:hypothetical protein